MTATNIIMLKYDIIIILYYFQVLRSADRWSTGTCENSILKAYIHTIENSEHFIYIEVTLSSGNETITGQNMAKKSL